MGLEYENVLVTGAAGFIGFHLSKRLLADGIRVTGFDNINPYYDVQLKKDRLAALTSNPEFTFFEGDLADRQAMDDIFSTHKFDIVVNMAAQAGVRYSLENPHAYVDSNLVSASGFCLVQLSLRRQHQDAIFGAPQC
jgi:UDP-glucuronate 4-epimerase